MSWLFKKHTCRLRTNTECALDITRQVSFPPLELNIAKLLSFLDDISHLSRQG